MHKKHILLLYITEVSGHHTASCAIEKALHLVSNSVTTLNINAFRFTSPLTEKITNKIYTTVIKRTPKLWDLLYDNRKFKKKIERIKKHVDWINSQKIKKLIEEFNPNAVVCTQAYPCSMVSMYKKIYKNSLPLFAVLTDFAPHAYWFYENVDYYICPHEKIADRIIKEGIPPEKVKPFGIPHDPDFRINLNRKTICQHFLLDERKPTILIMGGGQGLGPIKSIVRSLEKLHFIIQVLIVTGTNKKLFLDLKKKARQSKHKIVVFGYTNKISELMSISDVIITKPGGITTSEALTKQLPIIIIKPIPGQEANNTLFLTQEKAAIKVEKPENIHSIITDLFEHPEKKEALQQACKRLSKPSAAIDTAKFILENCR
ncbi:MAG: glycosyltransferase [Candidatus Omnitrophica bacterium]|nr:glycosyltransferase [Candidatus Omnitrophota bacterium]